MPVRLCVRVCVSDERHRKRYDNSARTDREEGTTFSKGNLREAREQLPAATTGPFRDADGALLVQESSVAAKMRVRATG